MRKAFSIIFCFALGACVDRIQFDIAKSNNYGIVIDGFISDKQGPYEVKVSKAFDIESKETRKTAISVRRLVLSDSEGTREELSEIKEGTYQTKTNGIRGHVGGVYKLRVELLDGKIYESVSDTLPAAGKMNGVYFSFNGLVNLDSEMEYGFDILANSSRGNSSSNRFMWTTTGTFQSETHPENAQQGCFLLPNGVCNRVPPCSGLRNVGTTPAGLPSFERVAPCECCTCWYKIFNSRPIISDNNFTDSENFSGIWVDRIPLNGWIFMHKIRVEVNILSLSRQSFRFWKAIKDQKNAVNSLFQPISGKIPFNFIQLAGDEAPVQGIFYATAISSESVYITRNDVPRLSMIPSLEATGIGWVSCLELFPNATNVKPLFWED